MSTQDVTSFYPLGGVGGQPSFSCAYTLDSTDICGPTSDCVVVDDGSLAARLHDEPGLADALLGVDLLDPGQRITEWEYPAAARLLDSFIESAIANGLAPIATMSSAYLSGTGPADFSVIASSDNRTVTGQPAAATPVDDQARIIELLVAVRQRRNALETAEALLLEQARQIGLRCEADFIDDRRLAQFGDSGKRTELVQRAIVADVALALHDGHDALAQRMYQGQALLARAPRTLANAVAGRVCWRNAALLADQVAELAPSVAARVDAAAAERSCTATPALFRRRLRKIVEDVHPVPMEVRHADAACKRNVRTDLAADGMGYLTLFAPVVAINAIWDRLTRTAKRVRYGTAEQGASTTDARTLEQLRADTAIALLLDDGTLDLAAAQKTGDLAPQQVACQDDEPEHRVCAGPLRDSRFSLAQVARSIRPKVFVTVPVLSLIGAVDAMAMLDGDIPIDADTARELAGLATSFTRILTDPYHGDVIGIDATRYRPPADLKQWIQLRDATCRFPGCIRRSVEADIDHNDEWSQGGHTTASNLSALCRRHHSLKTIGAFTTETPTNRIISPDAPLTWISPTGQRATTTPEAIPTTLHPPGYRLPKVPQPDPTEHDDYPPPPF